MAKIKLEEVTAEEAITTEEEVITTEEEIAVSENIKYRHDFKSWDEYNKYTGKKG